MLGEEKKSESSQIILKRAVILLEKIDDFCVKDVDLSSDSSGSSPIIIEERGVKRRQDFSISNSSSGGSLSPSCSESRSSSFSRDSSSPRRRSKRPKLFLVPPEFLKEKTRKRRPNSCLNGSSDGSPKLDDNLNDTLVCNNNNVPSQRCRDCRQLKSDNPNLKLFPGDSSDAVEEFIALTDDRLSLPAKEDSGIDELPQFRLTNFSVYDRHHHLTRFDTGLIENNKDLFFSGVVKPLHDVSPGVESGVPAKCLGPIFEWWIGGYDDGDEAVMGFSTSFADYYLSLPAPIYASYLNAAREKSHLAKLTVDFLSARPDADYPDLLNQIRSSSPPSGMAPLTEDAVFAHAEFIVSQLESLDETADEDEPKLLSSPCMMTFLKLTGVKLGTDLPTEERKVVRPIFKKTKTEQTTKDHRTASKASTTPLVHHIFESIFAEDGVLDDSKDHSSATTTCKKEVKKEEEEDGDDEDVEKDEEKYAQNTQYRRIQLSKEGKQGEEKRRFKRGFEGEWMGSSIGSKGKKDFYSGVRADGKEYRVGDHVLIAGGDLRADTHVGLVRSFWSDASGEMWLHAHWLERASETVLEEAGDPHELFLVDDCEDQHVSDIVRKVTVIEKSPSSTWFEDGGLSPSLDNPLAGIAEDDAKDRIFFCQKWYDPNLARFEDPPVLPPEAEQRKRSQLDFCEGCYWTSIEDDRFEPVPGSIVETDSSEPDETAIEYESIVFDKVRYKPGDCVYALPSVYDFVIPAKTREPRKTSKSEKDSLKYPEYYRKVQFSSDYVKGSNDSCPPPYRVARILKIFSKTTDESDDVTSYRKSREHNSSFEILVRKFYRPEDTHLELSETRGIDLNCLFWSDEETTIDVGDLRGKCFVRYFDPWTSSAVRDEYFLSAPDRFYFQKTYDSLARRFCGAPMEFLSPKSAIPKCDPNEEGKDLMVVVEKLDRGEMEDVRLTPVPEVKAVEEKLRCLDVFAGCGGLSEGLHQAGIVDTKWAIEKVDTAAAAFKLNNPDCTVFTEDCNDFLKLVMNGEKTYRGQVLPQKGEVDLLVGGPPCQGFSQMNRWNKGVYSKFKNSLIVSYLAYCDFYRPRFFILENVRNFVSFQKNMILRTVLRCLIRMGYQCTFGILQAGSYGVAQTRRRAILFAAAPGEILPHYPEPRHAFVPRGLALSVSIGEQRYESCVKRMKSAPLRTITVQDVMGDLPAIKNGDLSPVGRYGSKPKTQFQRLIRKAHGGSGEETLHQHFSKPFAPLVEERMRLVPLQPGSDWRDLPNICVKLKNGMTTDKLVYTHHDSKSGKGPGNTLRGVCHCVEGRKAKCDNQSNTLIPWCLPHSAHRNNQWSGLYGRLEWEGHFSTTVTDPEPMTKQGRVLHPEQHRVVSIRECARSQGFPDYYLFEGSTMHMYRQIGNAVPPPLARALGYQLMLAIAESQKKTKTENNRCYLLILNICQKTADAIF